MKKYNYNGNLHQDIKQINKKIDGKAFLIHVIIHIIVFGISSMLLYSAGIISSPVYASSFLGSGIGTALISCRYSAKEKAERALNKISNLYADINLNFSNRALSMLRMKECIAIQKKERIIEDYDSNNQILTPDEKLVTYFYLLDPKEKLQVLRQVRNELKYKNNPVYLLEEEDIKRENIEIPVVKTLKLKNK